MTCSWPYHVLLGLDPTPSAGVPLTSERPISALIVRDTLALRGCPSCRLMAKREGLICGGCLSPGLCRRPHHKPQQGHDADGNHSLHDRKALSMLETIARANRAGNMTSQ